MIDKRKFLLTTILTAVFAADNAKAAMRWSVPQARTSQTVGQFFLVRRAAGNGLKYAVQGYMPNGVFSACHRFPTWQASQLINGDTVEIGISTVDSLGVGSYSDRDMPVALFYQCALRLSYEQKLTGLTVNDLIILKATDGTATARYDGPGTNPAKLVLMTAALPAGVPANAKVEWRFTVESQRGKGTVAFSGITGSGSVRTATITDGMTGLFVGGLIQPTNSTVAADNATVQVITAVDKTNNTVSWAGTSTVSVGAASATLNCVPWTELGSSYMDNNAPGITEAIKRYGGIVTSTGSGASLVASNAASTLTAFTGLSTAKGGADLLYTFVGVKYSMPADKRMVLARSSSIDYGVGEGASSQPTGDILGTLTRDAGPFQRLFKGRLGYDTVNLSRGGDGVFSSYDPTATAARDLITLWANPTHILLDCDHNATTKTPTNVAVGALLNTTVAQYTVFRSPSGVFMITDAGTFGSSDPTSTSTTVGARYNTNGTARFMYLCPYYSGNAFTVGQTIAWRGQLVARLRTLLPGVRLIGQAMPPSATPIRTISSMTASGTTVTAVLSNLNQDTTTLSVGQSIVIAGTSSANYAGTWPIASIADKRTITFTVNTAPTVSPAVATGVGITLDDNTKNTNPATQVPQYTQNLTATTNGTTALVLSSGSYPTWGIGAIVWGNGIPDRTVVNAVSADGKTLTLSNAATSSGTFTNQFSLPALGQRAQLIQADKAGQDPVFGFDTYFDPWLSSGIEQAPIDISGVYTGDGSTAFKWSASDGVHTNDFANATIAANYNGDPVALTG